MSVNNWPKFSHEVSEIKKLVGDAKRAIIAGHIAPDADSIGSALAFYFGLKQKGIKAQVVFQDDIPDNLFFLPEAGSIIKPEAIDKEPDLVVMVDCATQSRTGDGWIDQYCEKASVIAIDHHLVGKMPKGVTIVDEKAAAAAELIYRLLLNLGVEITPQIANCLYAGLASDTGGFIYNNTTSESFEIAGELLDLGVDMETMRINLFENRSMPGVAVLGFALMNMRQSEDKSLTWTFVSDEFKAKVRAKSKDCDNIASYTMFPNGVKLGIFFEEDLEEGKVKISFRSRLGYDVSLLAAEFGGGGHAMASGCRIRGNLKEIMPKVLAAANKLLNNK